MCTIITFQSSPQIWRNPNYNHHSPWACLPQSKLEHRAMLLVGRQGESRLLLQGGESAQKKGSWIHSGRKILRQQEKPAKCKDFKNTGLDWSHPSGKSRTGMVLSILRQLGELLDKAVDIVPATLCCWMDTRICWKGFNIFIFITPLFYGDYNQCDWLCVLLEVRGATQDQICSLF